MEPPKVVKDPLKSSSLIKSFVMMNKMKFKGLVPKIMDAIRQSRRVVQMETGARYLKRYIDNMLYNSIVDPHLLDRMKSFVENTYIQHSRMLQEELYKLKMVPTTMAVMTPTDEDRVEDRKDTIEKMASLEAERLSARIHDIIDRAYHNAEPLYKIKKELQKSIKVSKKESARIARTELIKTMNLARLERMTSSGIEYYQWVSAPSFDERLCPLCGELNGKVIKLGRSFSDLVRNESSKKIMGTRQIYYPPAHPNCRCTIRPSYAPVITRPLKEPKFIKKIFDKFPGLRPKTLITQKIGPTSIDIIQAEELEDWHELHDLYLNESKRWGGDLRKRLIYQAMEAKNRAMKEDIELFERDNLEEMEKPKWTHYPLTKDEIYYHYARNWDKLYPELKGRRVAIRNRRGVILRNWEPGGKPIEIKNKNDLKKVVYNKNAVELIPELSTKRMKPSNTRRFLVDLDSNRPIDETVVKKTVEKMKTLPVNNVQVIFSGKRGYHVRGDTKKSYTWKKARKMLREAMKPLSEQYNDIIFDLSPMKRRGVSVSPYSLRYLPTERQGVAHHVQFEEWYEKGALGTRDIIPEKLKLPSGRNAFFRKTFLGIQKRKLYTEQEYKLQAALPIISALKHDLDLSDSVQKEAKRIFKKAYSSGITQGRKTSSNAAVSVYNAMRSLGMSRPIKDFLPHANVKTGSFVRAVKKFQDALNLPKFKVGKRADVEEARKYYKSMKRTGISKRKVARMFGVSPSSIGD
nr:MAG: minor head protein [Helarchaeota virus Nidhogg Meg22_1214]